jgi:hypothetical protein
VAGYTVKIYYPPVREYPTRGQLLRDYFISSKLCIVVGGSTPDLYPEVSFVIVMRVLASQLKLGTIHLK